MPDIDRREAFKAFGALVAGAGLTVTPVATKDVERLELIIFHLKRPATQAFAAQLRAHWERACEGTALQNVKVLVMDQNVDVEFVRR